LIGQQSASRDKRDVIFKSKQMTNTKYCGFENYSTWCVALWLDNNQAVSEYWHDQAEQVAEEAPQAPQVQQGLWNAN
jgi:hypothetical protein